MPAGTLRQLIRFDRRRQGADDGYGNTVYEWQPFAGPFSARVEQSSGSEEVLAERLQGISPVEITVHACAATRSVEPQDRAVDMRSGRSFNITSVIGDEKGGYLTMTAVAGGADG